MLATARSYRLAPFVEAAGRLGIEAVVGLHMDPQLAEFWRTPLALDFSDPDISLTRIREYAAERPLRAVLAVDDSATVLAAHAAEALGFPHNPPDAALAGRDKQLMRERLAAARVPVPRFQVFSTEDDPLQLAARVRFPCIVKPPLLSGSRGVIRADDPAGFVAAFRRTKAILQAEAPAPVGQTFQSALQAGMPAPRILVEEFIPGFEVALEGILTDGDLAVLALFDKPDPLDGPFFEETLYVTPSRLPVPTQEAIRACAAAAAAALGLREGPLHAELRVNERGPWLVEAAGRSIGGLCSRILTFGTGLTLEELILRHACGLPLALDRRGAAAGVMMIPIPHGGVFRRVHGLDDARAVTGIEDVQVTVGVGQTVVPLPEGASYLGFLFARADTPNEVETALRAAHGKLRFDIAPELRVIV